MHIEDLSQVPSIPIIEDNLTAIANDQLTNYKYTNSRKNTASTQKPVEQLDLLTGEVVHRYSSATEAASLMSADQSSLSTVCLGKAKTAYNFKWRFYTGHLSGILNFIYLSVCTRYVFCDVVNSPEFYQVPGVKSIEELIEIRNRGPKFRVSRSPIEQLDMDSGDVVRRYPSANTAAKEMEANQGGITQCCMNKSKSAYNFRWRFYEGPLSGILAYALLNTHILLSWRSG
jgi:hypothetical protein